MLFFASVNDEKIKCECILTTTSHTLSIFHFLVGSSMYHLSSLRQMALPVIFPCSCTTFLHYLIQLKQKSLQSGVIFPSYDYTTEFVRSAAVFADFIVNMKAGHSVYILGVTQMPPFLWLYLWGTQISVTVAVSGSKPAVLVYQAGVGQEAVLPNVYFLLFSS